MRLQPVTAPLFPGALFEIPNAVNLDAVITVETLETDDIGLAVLRFIDMGCIASDSTVSGIAFLEEKLRVVVTVTWEHASRDIFDVRLNHWPCLERLASGGKDSVFRKEAGVGFIVSSVQGP